MRGAFASTTISDTLSTKSAGEFKLLLIGAEVRALMIGQFVKDSDPPTFNMLAAMPFWGRLEVDRGERKST